MRNDAYVRFVLSVYMDEKYDPQEVSLLHPGDTPESALEALGVSSMDELMELVDGDILKLSEHERAVAKSLFGIEQEASSVAETAKRLGTTKEGVRQILTRVSRKCRGYQREREKARNLSNISLADPLEKLCLSVRTYDRLRKLGINSVSDLKEWAASDGFDVISSNIAGEIEETLALI